MNQYVTLALQILAALPPLVQDSEALIAQIKSDPKTQQAAQKANQAIDDLKAIFTAVLPHL